MGNISATLNNWFGNTWVQYLAVLCIIIVLFHGLWTITRAIED